MKIQKKRELKEKEGGSIPEKPKVDEKTEKPAGDLPTGNKN